jgi:hypothetical protein
MHPEVINTASQKTYLAALIRYKMYIWNKTYTGNGRDRKIAPQ